MIESRRGAGWHQFSGLSSPIVQLYASYYRPGTLTTGFDTFVREAQWSDDRRCLKATLDCTRAGRMAVLVVTAPDTRAATLSVPDAKISRRYDGLWEIVFEIQKPSQIALEIS
jgi:hypothetical protein